MKKTLSLLFAFFICTGLFAQIVVTNPGDSGPGTLRDAVASAPAGSTIDMTSLTSPVVLQSVISIGVDLKFVGTPNSTIIDGGGTTQLFHFISGTGTTGVSIEMDGLILQNSYNGVIRHIYAISFKASNCIFRNNTKVMHMGASALIIGGSLDHLFFKDCTFENNTSTIYSLITASGITIDIIGCKFINNNCGGPSVFISGATSTYITKIYVANSEFRGNINKYDLGGVLVINGTYVDADITNSVFTGNELQSVPSTYYTPEGGAIRLYASFANPTAFKCKMTNLTISNNYAYRGGGIACINTIKVDIGNCIIAGNHSTIPQAEDLYFEVPPFVATMNSLGNNLIGINPVAGSFSTPGNDLMGTTASPLDPKFIAPATVAPTTSGDYRLLPCSPAVNTGKDALVPDDIHDYFGLGTTVPLSKDVDGNDRFKNTVDRGAYEQQITTPGAFYYPDGHYVCAGKTFPVPYTGGLTGVFTATPSGLVIHPTTGIITSKFSAPGAYTITFTTTTGSACGPSLTSTLNYYIIPNPVVTIIDQQSTVWPYSTTALVADVTGGSGSYTYRWSGIGYNGGASQVVSPCSGAWYNVTITDQVTGCEATTQYYFHNSSNRACSPRSRSRKVVTSSVGSTEAWMVFPNPTSGTFSLDLEDIHQDVNVSITDLTGKVVYSALFNNERRFELNLGEKPTGVYFVNVNAGEYSKSFKVIRQ